ncbi:hereditary hemochromatosis protein homolog [Sphaerodactylus townsendi]|uniref:hereditary hemochromatosis protein homolog n=1 Tax=Sphaerodactylus townsendi TaxID=933632 RepID=UPI0020272064|nr:hereditary hemochromatosis protein homolog [Sphaerodactylus townsendi]
MNQLRSWWNKKGVSHQERSEGSPASSQPRDLHTHKNRGDCRGRVQRDFSTGACLWKEGCGLTSLWDYPAGGCPRSSSPERRIRDSFSSAAVSGVSSTCNGVRPPAGSRGSACRLSEPLAGLRAGFLLPPPLPDLLLGSLSSVFPAVEVPTGRKASVPLFRFATRSAGGLDIYTEVDEWPQSLREVNDGPFSPVLCAANVSVRHCLDKGDVHYAHFHILSPEAAVGVPKIHTQVKVNGLLLMSHDHRTNQLTPRNGYPKEQMGDTTFWQVMDVQCHYWETWAENIFRNLVREMNSTLPQSNLYYMQVLHTCDLDEGTGAFRHLSRYALNGEDMLYYQGGPKRWLSSHPAAAAIAKTWNRETDKVAGLDTYTAEGCKAHIHRTAPFATRKMDQPVVTVYSRKRTEGQLYLVCHVADFYPQAIEVKWEWRGQPVSEEQVTGSRVLPNADHTFQTQLQISLEESGADPDKYECVVQHASLGEIPLRVSWGCEQRRVPLWAVIVILSVLAVLGPATLTSWLRKRKSTSAVQRRNIVYSVATTS